MDSKLITRRRLIASASATGVALAAGGVYVGSNSNGLNVLAQGDAATPGPATPTPLGPAIPDEFTVDTNWPIESYDLRATRDVTSTSISGSTVDQLGTAWGFPVSSTAAFGALTANPTIVGNSVFIQDSNANVYAVNLETGEQLWANTYNDKVPAGGPNGATAAYGLLFTSLGGAGDVIALKQETGEEVWRTNIRGPRHEGITTPPLVYDNTVYISTIPGSSEKFYVGGQRGVIYALNAADGLVLWYFDTTTDNLWGNPTVNSGGGFWHPPSVDEDGKLYVPIANPAPFPGAPGFPWGSSRPGDNLYTDSLLKMDRKTATLDWYLQVRPHDLFDLDNHLTPIIADVDDRKVVFTSGKHGVVYSVDRGSGEIIWQTPVGTHQNDDRTDFAEDEKVTVFPGILGGVETQFAYSASANLIIAPVVNFGANYLGTGQDRSTPLDFASATGVLVALNGSDGSIVWQVDLATAPYAGATICNDIVFSAGLDGLILAFAVADGTEVFRYQAPAGVNAMAAVSGDYLIIPAGGPLFPSSAATSQPVEAASQVVALKIGGEVQAQAAGTPEATPAEEASPATQPVGEGFNIDTVDLAFQPNALTIPANQGVKITVTNKGQLPHDFYCDPLSITTELIDPGSSTTVTINAAAGSYEFYCSVPGHKDAGMVGTLTVQ